MLLPDKKPPLHCYPSHYSMLISLVFFPHLLAVAGVYFDPDVYMENEGSNITVILKTNVTVSKGFRVLVNTRDNSAKSEYLH